MLNILVLYFDFISTNIVTYLINTKFNFIIHQIISFDLLDFTKDKFDLVLLFLPKDNDVDFLKVLFMLLLCCKPVIVLDPNASDKNRKSVSDTGAAYFPYPVSLNILENAISSLLNSFDTFLYADLKVNLLSKNVLRGGKNIYLRKKEFEILALFLRFPNKILTKEFIYTSLWDMNYITNTNTLEVHMSSLRKKLNAGFDTHYLKAVNCIGYKLI